MARFLLADAPHTNASLDDRGRLLPTSCWTRHPSMLSWRSERRSGKVAIATCRRARSDSGNGRWRSAKDYGTPGACRRCRGSAVPGCRFRGGGRRRRCASRDRLASQNESCTHQVLWIRPGIATACWHRRVAAGAPGGGSPGVFAFLGDVSGQLRRPDAWRAVPIGIERAEKVVGQLAQPDRQLLGRASFPHVHKFFVCVQGASQHYP